VSGRSVLGIRPLLWKNDWPVAGERFKEGVYSIESERRGYSLELAVDFVRMQQERQGWFNRNQMQQPAKPIANQTLEEVQGSWPAGDIPVRCGDYMFRPHQKWTITPVPEKGGYLTGPLFRISIEGTDRALTATENLELTTRAYDGAPEQLWRIEQLTDGTYRIMANAIPGCEGFNSTYCIYSAGDSTPTLAKYDFSSDNSKWNFRQH
jgi:arabinan endo-1,5-alpha-L-arabinosidase